MIKTNCTIITLLLVLIFSGQSEANEVKPLSGIFKKIFKDEDELLKQNWMEIYLNDETAKKYPKLKEALDGYNREACEGARDRSENYREQAQLVVKDNPEYFRSFYDGTEVIVSRADSMVLSLLEMSADYLGGAHGMYGWEGINFDTATGKQLKISDICNDDEKLIDEIIKKIKADYPKINFDPDTLDEKIIKEVVEDSISWTLEYKGVSLHFNPYDIAPYSAGLFTVTLLFEDYPDLFNSKYTQSPKDYCQDIPLYKAKFASELMDARPTLVHINNKDYLYVDHEISSAKRVMAVYDLNGDTPQNLTTIAYTLRHIEDDAEIWWIMTDPYNIQICSSDHFKNVTAFHANVNEYGTLSF